MASKLKTNYLPEIPALLIGRKKPAMVTVNLTDRCNQHCIYCELGAQQSSEEREILTTNDLQWVIDQMVKNQLPRLSLCGGEPFLFEGLFKVISYAGEKNIRCTITTNGMTAYKLSESELEILKSCKSQINISIDSFRDEILTLTRGTPAALQSALKSIQLLQENSISVTVLAAISKYNYHELSNFLEEAFNRNIKQVLFQPLIYYSNYPEKSALEHKSQLNVPKEYLDKLMAELRAILKFERNHPIKTNVYRILPWISHYLTTATDPNGNWFFNEVLRKFYCREIDAIIDISYYGDIQPCGLASAKISIHEHRDRGLLSLWMEATAEIKNDLARSNYRAYCNGCCHHFSRNMLASIMKHPLQNRSALLKMTPLLASRIGNNLIKRIKYSIK